VLQALVEQQIKATGLKKTELLERLGYQSITKGNARFANFLQKGTANVAWLRQVASALDLDFDNLVKANRATQLSHFSDLQYQPDAAFRPHLEILVAERNLPEALWVLQYHEWKIILPSGLRHRDNQNEWEEVKQIFRRYYEERNGWCLKSKITGYRYHRQAESCLDFNLEDCVTYMGKTPKCEFDFTFD